MAESEFNFGAAVLFGTKTALGEANYNATLDAAATTLALSDGLVLGASGTGIGDTGITLGFERRKRDKAVIGTSFTRDLSDILDAKGTISTFTFSFPFTGSRNTATTTPVDADMLHGAGEQALLQAAGLRNTAASIGQDWAFNPGDTVLDVIDALVYYYGNRVELADCTLESLSIDFTPGDIPVATATFSVGSVKDFSLEALPSGANLDYGVQQSVAATPVRLAAFSWGDDRSFTAGTLEIAFSTEDTPTSNSTTGILTRTTDRVTKFSGTLYANDTTNTKYEYEQLIETLSANLDQLGFRVGTTAVSAAICDGYEIILPDPELEEYTPAKIGDKAGVDFTVRATSATANTELQINFD